MFGYTLVCCQFLVSLVFAVSVVSKVRSRERYGDFVTAVAQLAPGLPVRPAAATVVVAETAVLVSVLVPATTPFGFVLALALLAAFTAAIAAAIRRRHSVSCQCFGASSAPVGRPQLARNAVLLLIAAAGLVVALSPARSSPDPGVLAMAVLTGAAGGLAVVFTDEIADLFRSNH